MFEKKKKNTNHKDSWYEKNFWSAPKLLLTMLIDTLRTKSNHGQVKRDAAQAQ